MALGLAGFGAIGAFRDGPRWVAISGGVVGASALLLAMWDAGRRRVRPDRFSMSPGVALAYVLILVASLAIVRSWDLVV